MIRRLVVAALLVCGTAGGVACGGVDLVVDDERTDQDPTDQDVADQDGDVSPPALAAPELNIQVYDTTSTTMLVRWQHDAPAGCCTYRVYYGGSGEGPFTLFGEVSAFPTITGLTAETLYYVYVIAVDDGVESPRSFVRAILTKPGQATGFHTSRVGGGGVVVAWDAVAGASGFNVYRSEPGSTEVSEASPSVHVDGNTTSAVVQGLESNATYAFRMNVEKGVFRLGDLSEAITATTDGPVTVSGFTPAYGYYDQPVTVTGEHFGTVASELTVIFEGEGGPGDERTASATAVTETSLSTTVPRGARPGPIAVRRFLYGDARSPASYQAGPMLELNRVYAGTVAVTSLHAASRTQALAGLGNGVLLRSNAGNSFAPLAYASALADAHDCADAPGDTEATVPLSSIQCVGTDCLVARRGTCNAVRIADTFALTPAVTLARIAQGATWLACGDGAGTAACLAIDQQASVASFAYTASFPTAAFTEVTPTLPGGSDYAWQRVSGDAEEAVIFGAGGMLVGDRDGFTAFTDPPSGAAGGDCVADDASTYCVAASDAGVSDGSGATAGVVDFAPVTDVVAGARFRDATCLAFADCIAVGVIDEGDTTNERGVIAQTHDGERWFYRFVGNRGFTTVACAGGVCFIADRDGGIWRGN